MSRNYSATQNNGKITSQTDNLSGEQVVYTYDALNRLATAQATSNAWGQSYFYDGFGNLTDQNVIAGTAPTYHVVPDPATNRVGSTDANGNATGYSYDVENRVLGGGGYVYGYAPGNKRLMRSQCCGTESSTGFNLPTANEEITFWSVTGQRMATYTLAPVSYSGSKYTTTANLTNGVTVISVANAFGIAVGEIVTGSGIPPYTTVVNVTGTNIGLSAAATGTLTNVSVTFTPGNLLAVAQTGTWYYFGGKLIKNKGGFVGADRLGSIGKYYPYGQERPSATTNGTEKFTGYMRDAETGLDYADQRYHSPGTGRFLTPDPYMASGGGSGSPNDPTSWNRYAYSGADPINHKDPTGQDWCWADNFSGLDCINTDAPGDGYNDEIAAQIAAALSGISEQVNLQVPTLDPNVIEAWSLTQGNDPIFSNQQLESSGSAPSGDVFSVTVDQSSYDLLLSNGLLQGAIVLPAAADEWIIKVTGTAIAAIYSWVTGKNATNVFQSDKHTAEDCKKQWEDAIRECQQVMGTPQHSPPRHGPRRYSVYECAKGLVDEPCGGTPVRKAENLKGKPRGRGIEKTYRAGGIVSKEGRTSCSINARPEPNRTLSQ